MYHPSPNRTPPSPATHQRFDRTPAMNSQMLAAKQKTAGMAGNAMRLKTRSQTWKVRNAAVRMAVRAGKSCRIRKYATGMSATPGSTALHRAVAMLASRKNRSSACTWTSPAGVPSVTPVQAPGHTSPREMRSASSASSASSFAIPGGTVSRLCVRMTAATKVSAAMTAISHSRIRLPARAVCSANTGRAANAPARGASARAACRLSPCTVRHPAPIALLTACVDVRHGAGRGGVEAGGIPAGMRA